MSTSIPESPIDGHQRRHGRRNTWLQRPWRMGALIIVCVFSPFFLIALMESGGPSTSEEDNTQEKSDVNNGESQSTQTSSSSAASEADSARRTTFDQSSREDLESTAQPYQLKELAVRISTGQSLCERLKQKLQEWAESQGSLFSPEESRKVAGDSELVKELVRILDRDRASLEDEKALSERLEAFRTALEGLREEGRDASEIFYRELSSLLVEVQSSYLQSVQDSTDIAMLKERTKVLTDEGGSLDDAIRAARIEAAKVDLERVVNDYSDDASDTELRLVDDVKSKVRDDEKVRLEKVCNELARFRSEKQRLKEEANAKALSRQQELDAYRLKSRFDLEWPRMKKYLLPLTSDGYAHLIDGDFRKIGVKGPVSYQRMMHAGFLNDGTPSLSEFFCTIGSSANDRQLGAFPPHIIGEGTFLREFELLLTIQTFVREFGPLMAEKGMLAP